MSGTIRFKVATVILSLLIPFISSAQKTMTAGGEYMYYVPSDVSLDKAREIALERAKIQIIADNFGTVVGVTNLTKTENTGTESSVSLLSLGESEVKGEWLETIGTPKFTESFEKGVFIVKVSVKGLIREIKTAEIPFEAKLLRNGTDDRNEDDAFYDNDDLYVSFVSAGNGYVALYLFDNSGVYRLLPLADQEEGSIFVRGGERNVFFNDRDCNYYLTCSEKTEWNRVYVIFSPNKFSRALDVSMPESYRPPYLTFESFQRWLTKSRKQDLEMRVVVKDISISKQ